MSSFKEKKILISAFNASKPDAGFLKYLNSLQSEKVTVIAFPSIDFGGSSNETQLKQLKDSIGLSLIMIKPGYVRKSRSNDQNQLFRWLTKKEENTHFDLDVERTDQLFIISEKGILYSVLQKGVSGTVLTQVLDQAPVEN